MKQPNIWIGTPEDIAEGIDDGHLQHPSGIFMAIGERGFLTRPQARRMGAQWREFAQRYPHGVFGFTVDGYDDDPRELWEIVEVARYVRWWAHAAGMDDFAVADRLVGPSSRTGQGLPELKGLTFLMACGVFQVK